jgi:hypothetical protein
MHVYGVQITEGRGTQFLWAGAAPDQDEAERLARQAFERARRRSPERFLMSSGQLK